MSATIQKCKIAPLGVQQFQKENLCTIQPLREHISTLCVYGSNAPFRGRWSTKVYCWGNFPSEKLFFWQCIQVLQQTKATESRTINASCSGSDGWCAAWMHKDISNKFERGPEIECSFITARQKLPLTVELNSNTNLPIKVTSLQTGCSKRPLWITYGCNTAVWSHGNILTEEHQDASCF